MTNLALVFPGQGSQFSGMGRAWYDAHGSVRDRFEQASEIVGYSLADLCFTAPPAELTRTRHAQVALLVLGYGMYEVVVGDRRPPVSAMAGHSLGEITALLAAGALDFEDAVRLVKVRGEAMEAYTAEGDTGMVAALRTPASQVEKWVEEFNAGGHGVQVANYNAEQQTVLAGTREELRALTAVLEERGARVARLSVAGAFHSRHMDGAVPAYVDELDRIAFTEPSVPVYSTVTGRAYESAREIREALSVQLTAPVRWETVVSALTAADVTVWIEVGPKNVLTKLIAGSGAVAHSLDDDAGAAYAALDRVAEERANRPGLVGLCLGAAAATRNRNFDDEEYAAGVVAPYRRLQELASAGAGEPTSEQRCEALDLLRTIMETKGVPDAEQEERISSILRRTGQTAVYAPTGAAVR
ncbi:[acyl-carrier-protein] S-malonyltransferase [Nocardiopsis mwathae]|uniref:[acyl-carrier-protein] S-malonyltransferase n=1 Tax=Nocardiopsis mwathae TaxID=1472723 RepID=A0A7X0D3S2_9ACTN|nr:ACP S-malonyltransferase [Nocardiopsis mwathae]MBB6170493.1 [acyl-carrier-protein] S-malonyltransferase [Nocardiopsis mwathae]